MTTIKQLAEQLGVSKTAINNKMKLFNLEGHIAQEKNRVLLDDYAVKIVKSAFSEKISTSESAFINTDEKLKVPEVKEPPKEVVEKTKTDNDLEKVVSSQNNQQVPISPVIENRNEGKDEIIKVLLERIDDQKLHIEDLKLQIENLKSTIDKMNAMYERNEKLETHMSSVIENLSESLKASQLLHAGTMQQQLLESAEQKEEKKKTGFFARLFGR